jgi:hypothetical protein
LNNYLPLSRKIQYHFDDIARVQRHRRILIHQYKAQWTFLLVLSIWFLQCWISIAQQCSHVYAFYCKNNLLFILITLYMTKISLSTICNAFLHVHNELFEFLIYDFYFFLFYSQIIQKSILNMNIYLYFMLVLYCELINYI